MASITYFLPDRRKEGGAYVTATDTVKKLDLFQHLLVMDDGGKSSIQSILSVDGDLFKGFQD